MDTVKNLIPCLSSLARCVHLFLCAIGPAGMRDEWCPVKNGERRPCLWTQLPAWATAGAFTYGHVIEGYANPCKDAKHSELHWNLRSAKEDRTVVLSYQLGHFRKMIGHCTSSFPFDHWAGFLDFSCKGGRPSCRQPWKASPLTVLTWAFPGPPCLSQGVVGAENGGNGFQHAAVTWELRSVPPTWHGCCQLGDGWKGAGESPLNTAHLWWEVLCCWSISFSEHGHPVPTHLLYVTRQLRAEDTTSPECSSLT